MLRPSVVFLAALAASGATMQEAAAELLSSRPITVVIPFTPGASSDTLQRIVNKKVTENTGQTLVVESRPGGSGIIAAAVVKQAPPRRAHAAAGECGNPCR
jgi:tripartite-type tricarboxylate transporter receptor subunit TctC